MKTAHTLGAICTTSLISVPLGTSLTDALHLMRQELLSCIIITNAQGEPEGLISEWDILSRASEAPINDTIVDSIMSSPLITAHADLAYHEGYHLLLKHNIRHLPIINNHGKAVGLVTATDFITHLGPEYLLDVKYVDSVLDPRMSFIDESTSLSEALATFTARKTHCLLVGNQDSVKGIITERDIIRVLDDKIPLTTQVRSVMSSPIYSLPSGTPLEVARNQMMEANIRRILIIDENKAPLGLITRNDLISGLETRYIALLQASVEELNSRLAQAKSEVQSARFAQALERVAARMLNAINTSTLLTESINELRKVFDADRVSLLSINDLSFTSATILHESCSDKFRGVLETFPLLNFTPEMTLHIKKIIDSASIDVDHDSPEHQLHSVYQSWQVQTIFFAPMHTGTELPALLSVHFCKERHPAENSETRLLQEFAAYFSSALVSQHLKEQLNQDILKREQTEQYLKNILNTLPHGIQEHNLDGKITFSNAAHHKMLGYEEGELIGKYIWDLDSTPSLRKKTKARLAFYLENRIPPEAIEVRKITKQGQEIDISINWCYQYDQQGELAGMLSVMTDITSSKASHKALKASEKKYQSLFQSASDAILVIDPQSWKVCEANPKASKLLDVPLEELLNTEVSQLCSQECTSLKVLKAELTDGKKLFQNQSYLVTKKGQHMPVEIFAQELTLQDAQRIIISIHDLSFQVDAEERLRQSAVVFENSLEGVIITDASTRIISINSAFTRITGYTEAEVLGEKPAILHSGRHSPSFYNAMWEELRTRHHWKGEIWNRRKNGETYPQLLTITSICDTHGKVVNYIAVFSDLSALKASQQALEHQAHYDALTGLPNKLLLESRVLHRLELFDASHRHLAILFLDLDHFKNVNDSLGHLAGDNLLVLASERMKRCISKEGTLARLGGDEFIILMENLQNIQDSALMAEKLIQQFNAPFYIAGQEIYVSASIGISLSPQNGHTYDMLIRNADAAMYRAKAQGRNTYQYYSKEMTSLAFERLSFESMMRQALNSDGFFLTYQPQYCLQNKRLIGYEALLRWQHPTQGMIMPDKFIPIAEESGIIIPLGEWVINAACNAGSKLLKSGNSFERMAVNVSVPQLTKGNFPNMVRRALETTKFPAHKLEIEITESFLMGNEFQAGKVLSELRNMGISISIDDFGTGYSSLSYLKKLPIDKLKIDRSFIQHLPGTPEDRAIVQAVIALGKALNLEVIAEGVETPSQRDFLADEHCDAVQGYLFARPEALEELLSQ